MSRTKKDTRKYKKNLAKELNTYEFCIGGIPKSYKKIKNRSEKQRVKQALRNNKEIPIFKKNHQYDYY